MITYYFDINARQLVQSPGNPQPLQSQTWVYYDNYNLQVYICSQGIILPINAGDSLGALLFVPGGTLPEQALAIIGTPSKAIDANGNAYFLLNVNLATTALASLVQTPNKPATCAFHFIFYPADSERFSSSQDVTTIVNPDPTKDATGASPTPPGYPASPNVFEYVANKGAPSGYAPLDATSKVPVANLPPSTAGGDMLRSVYDTDNNGVVDTCDSIVSSRVTGLGTAATKNTPASGNATGTDLVNASDTRLSDSRVPTLHAATHNAGTDPIPLATAVVGGQGLCPPPDGTTIQIVSGRLTATTSGAGDMLKSVYDTNNDGIVDNAAAVQTHVVPPSGNATGTQIVLASDSRLVPATAGSPGLCPARSGAVGTYLDVTGAWSTPPSGGIGAHGCRLRNSAAEVYPPTNNILTWDTVVWGTDTFAPAAGGTVITIPAGQAGLYQVGAWIAWTGAPTTAGTYRRLAIRYKATLNDYLVSNTMAPAGTQASEQSVSTIWQFAAGDTIDVYVATDATGISILSAYTNMPAFWCMRIA